MGSKPRDQGTMSASTAGAQAADASLAKQADQSTAYAKQAHDLLFGAGTGTGGGTSAVTGGTLSKFLDPNSLNVSAPTGAYGLQYNKATENIANQGAQNRGAIARGFASRGFGNMPAGFTADQSRQELADESNQKGAAFTDLAGKSYADALNNFWNASNIASGSGAANTNAAISADSAAANNYANLYGTASTPKPSLLPTLVGGGLQAGGTIGAAAACPCEGAMILMYDGSEKMSQDVRKGEMFLGEDGNPCPVLEVPRMAMRPCVEVKSITGRTRTSADHTFTLPRGGYEFAGNAEGQNVRFGDGVETVTAVKDIGQQIIYIFIIGGSHSYRVDKFWSLS
jgi:hypothetical protein